MEVQIPLLGVILAAVAAVIIGSVWYSPAAFGKEWMAMIDLKDKEMKKRMNKAMAAMVVVSLLTAYVLAHVINYAHYFNPSQSWLAAGFTTACWVWLGFGLTTIVAHGAFEPRDVKIMVINAGNRLVTLLAMGLILGYFLG